MSTFAFADLFEIVADAVPQRTALAHGMDRSTYAELDQRADRVAGWLHQQGVRQGDRVGVGLRNRPLLVEALLGAYKLRACPVNVNYRLREAELRHLMADAPLVGLVHEDDMADDVRAAASGAAAWTCSGTDLAAQVAATVPRPRQRRSGDDEYLLYTGGTTGPPKGVVWSMEDAFFGCIGGGDPRGELGPVEHPDQLLDRLVDDHAFLPVPPLIHAAGMWTALRWLFAGSTVVLLPQFDPDAVWAAVQEHRVVVMNIVGDAMARPLLDALVRDPDRDLSSLRTIASGGAPLSPRARNELLSALPQLTLKDSYGSSETGVHGWSVHRAADPPAQRLTTRFSTVDTIVVDADSLRPVPDGVTGLVARTDRVPLRYHDDTTRSARTFLTIDGRRCAVTGDLGRREADGTLVVLGRGSQCINTGGEKVHPEEVEQVLRDHPDVSDVLVVGLPDELWGQRVVAITSLYPDASVTPTRLREHARAHLASFKVPKDIVVVDQVARTPAGKPDYAAARRAAASTLGVDVA